ncbi:uncharacterized protein [Halyomorpha halys]|uniref:uncharacterized protein n=1 Tax=Halyomorpha halys TaxID=286706 RepID=UPI0006D4E566|nr:uncharacterized protein LOC106682835 [Halyomorpha halys]
MNTEARNQSFIRRRDPEIRPAVINPSRSSWLLTNNITIRRPPEATRTQGTRNRISLNRFVPYQRTPEGKDNKPTCPICLNTILPVSRTKPMAVKCCGYVFCNTCIIKCQKQFKKCPLCNQELFQNSVLELRFNRT